jgi:hypothetical protein
MASWVMIAASSLGVAPAASPDDVPASTRIELRVETLANREAGPVVSCEVVLQRSANSPRSLASWSTLDDKARDHSGTVARCGTGAFHGSSAAPFLIQEVSADLGWSPGAMDPGPFGALVATLTVMSRQLIGASPEGKPAPAIP